MALALVAVVRQAVASHHPVSDRFLRQRLPVSQPWQDLAHLHLDLQAYLLAAHSDLRVRLGPWVHLVHLVALPRETPWRVLWEAAQWPAVAS